MSSSLDKLALQRLDNAAVVDFLTSTAGALCERGAISPKDTDNLRLVLSGINAAAESRERPLLLELERQNAEFLGVLTARYGVVGLCLNLIRHTVRSTLVDTERTIAQFGQALLKKAELLFNRPFYVFQGGRCLRQTLYSTVIIDYSETLAEACRQIEEVEAALSQMNPSDLAVTTDDEETTDHEIARALGFQGLVVHSLPLHAEREAQRRLTQALALVTDAAEEISAQLTANTGAEAAYDLVVACEWLKADCQRLAQLEFPQSESLMVWEVRRRNLLACLHGINEALRLVAQSSLASLGQDRTGHGVRRPDSVRRRLIYDLITAGITPPKAREATTALLTYLDRHGLAPREVLVGELGRIHPSLMPRSLEMLVTLEDGSTNAPALAEKTTALARARRLAESFKEAATKGAAILALLAFVLPGCGLKTRPQSDLVELRPDIPFHAVSPKLKPARLPVDAKAQSKDTAVTSGKKPAEKRQAAPTGELPDTANGKGAGAYHDTKQPQP